MQHAPEFIALTVVPMYAIHRSAAASLRSEHQAQHDDLTQLANRKVLVRETTIAIADSRCAPASRARCSCSTWTASRRSTTSSGTPSATTCCVRSPAGSRRRCGPDDLVVRLGGDEFAVLARRVRDAGRR